MKQLTKPAYIILTLCLFMILGSCSKNTNSTQPNNNTGGGGMSIFPTTINSYWVYNTYSLDSLGKLDTKVKPTFDSMVVAGNINILQKDAQIFRTFAQNATGANDTTDNYFYSTSNSINVHSSYFNNLTKQFPALFQSYLNSMFKIKEQWLLVVDADHLQWLVLDQPIDTGANIMGFKVTGNIQIIGAQGNNKEIQIGGQNFTAKEYIMTFNFNGSIMYNSIPIPLPITRKSHFYFVENIGMVENYTENSSFSIPLAGSYPIPGSDQVILKYNVSK